MKQFTCGFIGLGLIGGSIARAIREKFPKAKIIAYDINEETLELAKEEQIADVTTASIDSSFCDCDYIFLCAPVQKNDENLLAVKKILNPDCLLTDVGSVKTTIHEHIHAADLDACFIGGHPMAGSERVGFVNSKASLLENAYYILTPTDSVPGEKVAAFRALVQEIGAIPLVLSCQKHDYVTAAISHLPHVIAASLVNLVRESDDSDGTMKMVAAGGFKDITRIASSSAAMWQQICLTNTKNITDLLADYINALTVFKEELEARDAGALYEEFDSARIYRNSFINASSGPIKRSFSINVEIADRSGALAHIVMELAIQNINIKNIGIIHNRESEDGVLRIEFYSEDAMMNAAKTLSEINYSVNIRTLD